MSKALKSPCTYQGGKSRISKDIIDIFYEENDINEHTKFYDLCCGSGAISIELINRGVNPENIIMLDQSPWGLFWKSIGEGSFNKELFQKYIDEIPKELSKIQGHMKDLNNEPATIDTVYRFLLMQASSFGSKAIWLESETKWNKAHFRDYWLPTETSKRRSPVNPMMPMPNTLKERVEAIVDQMQGISGVYGSIEEFTVFEDNAIIYIDPPYQNTTGYGYGFDLESYVKSLKRKVYVSEGLQLTENAHLIQGSRAKGGISGKRKSTNEEWLNIYGD